MPFTFGYGSNMASRGLAAKGVRSLRARPARLDGWELAFDVPSVFRKVEGGVANVVEGKSAGGLGEVHGVLHEVDDEGLAKLDGIEAVGILYDRRKLRVRTYDGEIVEAETYVGVPSIRDAGLRPSVRYLRILVDGAREQELDPAWIRALESTPPHTPPRFGKFEPPADVVATFDAASLARNPAFVALNGVVFDLTKPSPVHRVLTMLRGGRDLTPIAVALGAGVDSTIDERERKLAALHELQHELALEYPIVGRFVG
jgi:sulfite reductase (NADPH) flavoprotein alpha-component